MMLICHCMVLLMCRRRQYRHSMPSNRRRCNIRHRIQRTFCRWLFLLLRILRMRVLLNKCTMRRILLLILSVSYCFPLFLLFVCCQYKGSFKFGFFYVDVWPANVVKFKGLMIKCVPFENEPLFSAVVFYKK